MASLIKGCHSRLTLHVGNKILVLRERSSLLIRGLVCLLAEQRVRAGQTQSLRIPLMLRRAANRYLNQVS